jgi:hypothetical protein
MDFFRLGGYIELRMTKRVIDLSLEELAAMGAKAARAAAQRSQRGGTVVTGTVTTYEQKRSRSVLAQLHPSGTVTFVRKDDEAVAPETATKTALDKAAD